MTKMDDRPLTWLIGLALMLTLTATDAMAAPSQIQVSYADGQVSLQAEKTPLRAVLLAVAEAAGLTVKLRGQLDEAVSPSIRDLPIRQAIGRLLDAAGHSFVLQLGAGEPAQSGRLLVIAANGAGAPVVSLVPTAERSDEALDPEGEAIEEAVVMLEEMLLEDDALLREAAAEALAGLEVMTATN